MQNFGSRREKFNFHNYLTSLVKALENKHTVIDLRNESCVSGKVKHVDGFMNVEMQDAVLFDPRGKQHNFNDFYISARNIRYVHIPEGCSSIELLNGIMKLLERSIVKEPKKRNFKTKRAQQYNAEILASLKEPVPGPSKT